MHIYDALQQFWQGGRLKNVQKVRRLNSNQCGAVSGVQEKPMALRRNFGPELDGDGSCKAMSRLAGFRKNNAAAGRKSKEHAFGYHGI
ncbi:hypothetical protein HJB51_30070 [Rhizobium lentis]|uniref:hypothetical protein n=1 Tax=Rhizobium lentis TaxID=1138194 RepID=UPI001A91D955|nr:hypothetical protein [Rhizobium lentis]MBX4999573.1 hypothetical protein [Rhizobium lentis]MBX5017314.1 hypothetical protein [Rhizobium lentis]MBX5044677.1 hypothetical protein [Rhizobium lentis]MBX5063173.1 hypothetical protein [Rhizobium lentis]MBX5074790.1 hypothetical protein [Rhizobium lentis]